MLQRQTEWLPCPEGDEVLASYSPRLVSLPAFDLIGFTEFVVSGGTQYTAVRTDGRWEVLRQIAGDDKTIYGVASHAPDAPEGHYRYTVAVNAAGSDPGATDVPEELFVIHIGASDWVVFALECFSAQYGQFWTDAPYSLVRRLGLGSTARSDCTSMYSRHHIYWTLTAWSSWCRSSAPAEQGPRTASSANRHRAAARMAPQLVSTISQ